MKRQSFRNATIASSSDIKNQNSKLKQFEICNASINAIINDRMSVVCKKLICETMPTAGNSTKVAQSEITI